jgi:hypothetical protein
MRSRSPNQPGETFPGPGYYYNDESLIGGPDSIKYSLGEKNYVINKNENPGPGAFYI